MPRLRPSLRPAALGVAFLLSAVGLGAAAATSAPAADAGGGVFEAAMAPAGETPVDRLVGERLRRLGIKSAPACSDAVFVRRVFLDTIGTLPTADEARDFVDDPAPGKRARLIDRLLERPEYADYWAMRWGDLLRVKAEFPINLWPNAAQAYHRWIVQALRENRPADAFARELITATGSNFRGGPANFYRAVQGRDADTLARAVALTFWGVRVEKWPPERRAGLGGFFTGVRYKTTGEWKEEIVYLDPLAPTDPARPPFFPDGARADIPEGKDPREVLADWMLDPRHPWLARSLANRAWAWFLGRGIVHEPDDFRPDNPPSNPELLAYLERELIASRYDMKALFRLILNSRAYQRSAFPPAGTDAAAAWANFASYTPRRLEAEVLADALNQITGGGDTYVSPIPEPFSFVPTNVRAIALPDGSITGVFLEKFGRSPRDSGLEAERDNAVNATQRLHLLNSTHVLRKLEKGPAMRALLKPGARFGDSAVDRIYLAILSRRPTAEERRRLAEAAAGRREALEDLAWALINGPEFIHRH